MIEFFRNEITRAVLIVLGFSLLGGFLQLFLRTKLRKWVEQTRTRLDNMILDIVSKPVVFLLIFVGIFSALKTLTVLRPLQKWIDGIGFIVICFLLTWMIANIVSKTMEFWLRVQKRYERTPQLITKGVILIIYLIALLVVLSHFRISITPFIATLGVGALAVSLALQNTLSNFFAGLHLVTDRPITVGDFIELSDTPLSGNVMDIGWRSTRIRTLSNTVVVVPNARLAESTIINDSMPDPEIAVLVTLGVAFDSDLAKVETVTSDVAADVQKTVPGAVPDFKPFIRYNAFGESNIGFTVILRARSYGDKFLLTHEFIKALKKRYDREGIEISWPMRTVVRKERLRKSSSGPGKRRIR